MTRPPWITRSRQNVCVPEMASTPPSTTTSSRSNRVSPADNESYALTTIGPQRLPVSGMLEHVLLPRSSVASSAAGAVGAKRTVTTSDSCAARAYAPAPVSTVNAGSEPVAATLPNTERSPALRIVNVRSANEPGVTIPKSSADGASTHSGPAVGDGVRAAPAAVVARQRLATRTHRDIDPPNTRDCERAKRDPFRR